MKKELLATLVLVAFASGCRSQLPPNPNIYTCPVSTGSNYTAMNSTTPVSYPATTYKDSAATGNYCYITQSVIDQNGSRVGTSNPSNIAGPFAVSGTQAVNLSWTNPTTGATPTGQVLSRAAAIQATLAPATVVNGNVAMDVKPALPTEQPAKTPYLASLESVHLTGGVK